MGPQRLVVQFDAVVLTRHEAVVVPLDLAGQQEGVVHVEQDGTARGR